jgi:hypothetical protein
MTTIAERPVRRLVTIADESGNSYMLEDGPMRDVMYDPARPGFSSARVWVTDATPVSVRLPEEIENLPHRLEPPPSGSVLRIVTLPPDDTWISRVTAKDVEAYFTAAGSPHASRLSPGAPHPYMQQTRTLDFCLVLEGEVTLVLETSEVELHAGDTIVQRGTAHAWSNRSAKPCVIAISSHDAASSVS